MFESFSLPQGREQRIAEKQQFENNAEAWFSRPPELYKELEASLHAQASAHPQWDCFDKKGYAYPIMARSLILKVFKECPFAFEVMSRSSRGDMEYDAIAGWYRREPAGVSVLHGFEQDTQGCYESGLSTFYRPVDDGHHTLDYERVLKRGLRGILEDIECARRSSEPGKDSIYSAMRSGLEALIVLAQRFAEAAKQEAECCEGADRQRMLALAKAIAHAPEYPAASFHEALNTLMFLYYAVPSLEGNNVSVFGHVDRLLWPYLRVDLQSGVLNQAQAYDLIWRFLAIPDARFGKAHTGTNSTVTLGGCDAEGLPVFNLVTQMIFAAYQELRFVDPKLNVRLSKYSPPALFDAIAKTYTAATNNMCIFNDDVLIPANVAVGKDLADCRLYVAGGCQENIIGHCEMNSRATVYMNLLVPLMAGHDTERWNFFIERHGGEILPLLDTDSFADVYAKTMHNIRCYTHAHISMKNRSEARGLDWNASPLHSALLGGCIESGRDMFAGGSKYAYGSISLTGVGTLIDSLLAIKMVVFEEGRFSLSEFMDIALGDFENEEALRRYIVKKAPKYSSEDPAIAQFVKRVFHDLAHMTDGEINTRGGRYEASLFSFYSCLWLGSNFVATPDGRKGGQVLSAGVSPSHLAGACTTQMLHMLKAVDLTAFPVVAVLDMKLSPLPLEAYVVLQQQFLDCGGSVLQINTLSQQDLQRAMEHPEEYEDLVVRVSGFSARFVHLHPVMQQEVLQRAVND